MPALLSASAPTVHRFHTPNALCNTPFPQVRKNVERRVAGLLVRAGRSATWRLVRWSPPDR